MGFVESCWIRCRLQIVAVSCFDGVGSGQKQSFVSNANLDHNSLVMPANVQVGFHAKLACIKSHIKVLSCAGHPSIVPEARAVFSDVLWGHVGTELQNTSKYCTYHSMTMICCFSPTVFSRDSAHPRSWNRQFLQGIRQRLPFRSARP